MIYKLQAVLKSQPSVDVALSPIQGLFADYAIVIHKGKMYRSVQQGENTGWNDFASDQRTLVWHLERKAQGM